MDAGMSADCHEPTYTDRVVSERILAGEELTDEDEYLNSAGWNAELHTLEVRQDMLHKHRVQAGYPFLEKTVWDTTYHLSRMVHEANPADAEENEQVKATKTSIRSKNPSASKPKAVTKAAAQRNTKKAPTEVAYEAECEEAEQEEEGEEEEEEEEEWEEVTVRQRRSKTKDTSSSPLKNKGLKTNTSKRTEPKTTGTTAKPKATGKSKATVQTKASNNNGKSAHMISAAKKPTVKKAPASGKKASIPAISSDEEEEDEAEAPAPAKRIIRRRKAPTLSEDEEEELEILARTPATKRRRVVSTSASKSNKQTSTKKVAAVTKGKSTTTEKPASTQPAARKLAQNKSVVRGKLATPKTAGKKNVSRRKSAYAQDSDVVDHDDDDDDDE